MKKITIGIVIIGIFIAGVIVLGRDSKNIATPQTSTTALPKSTPTPLPQTPTIDETTNLYLETQKLTPADFSKDIEELRDSANNF